MAKTRVGKGLVLTRAFQFVAKMSPFSQLHLEAGPKINKGGVVIKRILLVSVVLVALLLGACKADAEREAILTFTRQALAIEAGRDAKLKSREAQGSTLVAIFFLRARGLGEGLPSGSELKAQMLLLDCPPSLQGIKDSLVEAYRLEIEAAQLEGQRNADFFKGGESGRVQFFPRIDRFNVDSFKKGEGPFSTSIISPTGPWVMAQELRRDAYIKWPQLLREHGIDPAKEGFTALVLK